MNTNRIITGDALEALEELPENSIHMAMTSPPYWQLRDYGDDTNSVFGGNPDCNHNWVREKTARQGGQNTSDNPPDVGGNSHTQETRLRSGGVEYELCSDCGAYHGQLGLEPSPELFANHIADVLDEVKRVLRDDGSLWLNLGDTYKDKDLQQIPARVALELQDRGWTLRNRVTWAKPNPMPNSVKDRLNTTTEAIFHVTPGKDYWYDLDAIREQYSETSKQRVKYDFDGDRQRTHPNGATETLEVEDFTHPAGKNPGDVFEVTTKPFPDAHFAVYPPELCEKPIKATAPPKVCVKCGSPYERLVERERYNTRPGDNVKYDDGDGHQRNDRGNATRTLHTSEFKGWRQTCDCGTKETEPGVVLDPFAGAGTTLLKAKELRRRFVGIELNPEYADMARARIGITPDDPATLRDSDKQQGFESFTD